MRKLGRQKQISYPSHPDIIAAADLATAKLAMRTNFAGAKLRTGHLMNALALWISEIPDEELLDTAGPMLERLATFLGRDSDSVDPDATSDDPSPSGVNPVVASTGGDDLPKPQPKRAKRAK